MANYGWVMEGSALEGGAWQLEADMNGVRPWN